MRHLHTLRTTRPPPPQGGRGGGGGCNTPPPPVRPRYKKGRVRARVKQSELLVFAYWMSEMCQKAVKLMEYLYLMTMETETLLSRNSCKNYNIL